MKNERTRKDIKRNCAFHKDIGHTTDRYVALKDKIERLIRTVHFNKFIDDQYVANREERPRQWSPEKVHEILTIICGTHLAGESHNARDQYVKDAKTFPLVRVQKTEE